MKKSFQKHERLKSKRYFDALFASGKSVKAFPIRAIFLEFIPNNFPEAQQLPSNSQIAFAVPKKRFKKAVDRNRIKRQMREAYRLNKDLLDKDFAIVLVYLKNEKTDYNTIQQSIQEIVTKLNDSD